MGLGQDVPVCPIMVGADGRNRQRLDARFSVFPQVIRKEVDVTQPLPEMGEFDIIINAAAPADPASFAMQPVQVMLANIMGTHHVLQYAVKHGRPVVLQISSGEVYGSFLGERIVTENDQGIVPILSPRSCYPMGKRAAETLCSSYIAQYGMDVRIARPSHVFGPGFTDSDSRVSADFFRLALRGQDIVLKSDGIQRRT